MKMTSGLVDPREHDGLDGADPALERAPIKVRFPESQQLVFEVQLLAQPRGQTIIPLRDGEILPDGSQVQNRHGSPFLPQALDRAHHQGGLAHLARGQHIAEFTPQQALAKIFIGLALDIAGRIRP